MTIASRIKNLRENVGWSQSRLAKEANITPAAICMIEKGDRDPTTSTISKISNALKVDIQNIVDDRQWNDKKVVMFYRKFNVIDKLSEGDQELLLRIAMRLKK